MPPLALARRSISKRDTAVVFAIRLDLIFVGRDGTKDGGGFGFSVAFG